MLNEHKSHKEIHVSAFYRNIYDGAATSLYCAVSPDLKSQQCFYYSDCRVKQSSIASRYASEHCMSVKSLWGFTLAHFIASIEMSLPRNSCGRSALVPWKTISVKKFYSNISLLHNEEQWSCKNTSSQEHSVTATSTTDTNGDNTSQQQDTTEHWLIQL